jgi:N-acetylglucosamine kinase-like BadF-type ATPase
MGTLIGIDGGGSKTGLCAVSCQSGRVLRGLTDSASWRERGIGAVVAELQAGVRALVPQDADVDAIAAGMPCYGESAREDRALEQALRAAFEGIPLYIANDAEVGWAGSLALASGVNVVAGTGSIAFGRDDAGRTARCGGWDEFFSDEGSGYWLGRNMLQLFSRQSDGRAERGPLHTIVREAFHLTQDMQCIDYVRQHCLSSRRQVAALQRLLLTAAQAGDRDAAALYEKAAGELFAMAEAVRWQLDLPLEGWVVSVSGGMFQAGELLRAPFARLVEQAQGRLVPARYDPAAGAALLAAERFAPVELPRVRKLLGA